jgi:hypothetical protein
MKELSFKPFISMKYEAARAFMLQRAEKMGLK